MIVILLTGRLNGAPSGKIKLAISLALAASVITAAFLTYTYLDTSDKLAEKLQLASQQEQQIIQQTAAIEAQKSELESKTAELERVNAEMERVNLQMGSLSQELDETHDALQLESNNSEILEDEVDLLNEQAALLNVEISALQSKIKADELRIQELSRSATESGSGRVTVSQYGLGVDQNNHGMVYPIKVEIINSGTGALSVDINNVQYEPGFQAAVRAAAVAASQYSGKSIEDKDIIVRFAPEGPRIGNELVKMDGSSAGAIISAMIAAGLSDRKLDSSILVTGSIAEDGAVGRIGGLQEKLEAAEAFGAKAVLVPESQESESDNNTLSVIGVSNIDELMAQLTVH